MAWAAGNGDLELLQWLQQQDCPWDYHSCEQAAEKGHVHVLQWLYDHKYIWTNHVWARAIKRIAVTRADFKVLQWVVTNLVDPTDSTDYPMCHIAAREGNLHALQWLRAQTPPFPWSMETCENAAYDGHTEVLQWLRSQNPPCPWNVRRTLNMAIQERHWDTVQWIVSITTPDQWPHYSQPEDQRYYSQRQFLLSTTADVLWSRQVYWWLDAVTATSRDVLQVMLCPDLTMLVQRYC